MPDKGSPEREAFTDEMRETLRKWIAAGAPSFESRKVDFITLKSVLTSIREHLNQPGNRTAQPYLRYFSLAHVHNNPEFSEEDMRSQRAALSKVINSLSWMPRIVVPQAIDRNQTIYVVDVRDLGWDRGDLWTKVIDAYPYGLRYGGHPDTDLR